MSLIIILVDLNLSKNTLNLVNFQTKKPSLFNEKSVYLCLKLKYTANC